MDFSLRCRFGLIGNPVGIDGGPAAVIGDERRDEISTQTEFLPISMAVSQGWFYKQLILTRRRKESCRN